jgi:N-acetylglucosaminyl-diphospho-decaprenol L-rhamnosyltransferase
MTGPLASIVILSYARPAMLAESLRAALAQTHLAREVVVVDNESPRSPEIAAIVSARSGARLVRTGGNLGFATGMNIGLREARGELVLLTEDDMILDPDALERFVRAEAATRAPALFSGVIRDRDSGTVWSAGGEHRLGGVFSSHESHRGAARVDAPEEYETGYITGAFVFARTALLRELGGYRDEYFMYWEDVELCLRARRRGVRLVIVRDVGATHFTPSAGGTSALVEYHKVKNMLATYLLHAPVRVLPEGLARYGIVETVNAARRGSGVRIRLRALGWFLRNVPRLLRARARLARTAGIPVARHGA